MLIDLILAVSIGLAILFAVAAVGTHRRARSCYDALMKTHQSHALEMENAEAQLAILRGLLAGKDDTIKWMTSQLAMRGVKVIERSDGEPAATVAGREAR